MKKLWIDIRPIFLLVILWRLFLSFIQLGAPKLFVLSEGYLGITHWSNFDGVHYLSIAREGYRQYLEAFFPLYPLLIRWFSNLLSISPVHIGLIISHLSIIVASVLFYKLATVYDKKSAIWSTTLYMFFPASFFFASVYSDALFVMFATATLLGLAHRKWVYAGIFGMLASATRLFGLFLVIPAIIEYFSQKKKMDIKDVALLFCIPLGFIAFTMYLWHTTGDPLAFFHVQPAFGAQRSGEELILLPQVIWRYINIFFRVSPDLFLYHVASFEFISLVLSIILICKAWYWKIPRSFVIYSALVIITPTLTGTLSSLPRYMMSAFPLFLMLGNLTIRMRVFCILVGFITLIYFASAFLQGYFVA